MLLAAPDPSSHSTGNEWIPAVVIGFVALTAGIKAARLHGLGATTTERKLQERMTIVADLEQSYRTRPRRFLFGTWVMALRAHLGADALILALIGLVLCGFAQVRLWMAFCFPSPSAVSLGLFLLPLIGLAATLGLLFSGRVRPGFNRGTGLMLLGFLTVFVPGFFMTSGDPRRQTAYMVAALSMLLGAFMFGLLAIYGRKALGLDLGVTGRTVDISEESSPALLNLVRETAAATGLPTPRRILLAEQSSLATVAGSEAFAARVHELRLGLPELLELTEDELRAVIAHELEHQRHHGPLRVLLSTGVDRLRARPALPGNVRRREDLELRLCVLMRENEYSSDRTAARLDAAVAAQALARSLARAQLMRLFWASPEKAVLVLPEPPACFGELESWLEQQPWYADLLRRGYASALLSVTLPGSTHPELGDRLAALGQPPPAELRRPPGRPALDLLDDKGRDFLRRRHEEWRAKNLSSWADLHARLKAADALLRDPENAELGKLSKSQLQKRAGDLWVLRGPAEARPALEAYCRAHPDDHRIAYWLARAKLEANEPGAAEELRALSLAHPRESDGFRDLALHAFLRGRTEEARACWNDMLRQNELLLLDKAQRARISDDAELTSHALSPDLLRLASGETQDHGVIREAWVVRRKLEHVNEPPQHIVVLDFWKGADGRYGPGFESHRKAACDALIKCFESSGQQAWVLRADLFRKTAGRARMYPSARIK